MASHAFLRHLAGEDGIRRWVFYVPVVFMVAFFAVPVALTLVWSVFETGTARTDPQNGAPELMRGGQGVLASHAFSRRRTNTATGKPMAKATTTAIAEWIMESR